jgi:hypothetical protein
VLTHKYPGRPPAPGFWQAVFRPWEGQRVEFTLRAKGKQASAGLVVREALDGSVRVNGIFVGVLGDVGFEFRGLSIKRPTGEWRPMKGYRNNRQRVFAAADEIKGPSKFVDFLVALELSGCSRAGPVAECDS